MRNLILRKFALEHHYYSTLPLRLSVNCGLPGPIAGMAD